MHYISRLSKPVHPILTSIVDSIGPFFRMRPPGVTITYRNALYI